MRTAGGNIYLTKEEWDVFERRLNTYDPEVEERRRRFLSEEPKLDIAGIEEAIKELGGEHSHES